jgi:hypothetical protein
MNKEKPFQVERLRKIAIGQKFPRKTRRRKY